MVALAKLAAGALGVNGIVNGLQVVPTSPASLNVNVNPGEIYQLANIDATSYGSLAADTTHQVLKQGIMLDQALLSCPAPGTAGQSINYLIQATLTETDTGLVALPYYNASNPSVAWSGPNNSGTPQATQRSDACVVTVKAGAAAATGTQTTPAPDAGNIGLAVVTVANGQATITAANIVQYTGAALVPSDGLASNVAHAIYTKNVAGNSDVVLTAQEAAYPILVLQGALTGNINLIVPASSRQRIISNQTTGSYQITVKTAAGTGTVAPQGYALPMFCDGTNVINSVGAAQLMTSATIAQDFRLSLTSGLPVTTSDVTAATTIYAVPYRGNRIGLFDGTKWLNYSAAQFSIALNALSNAKPYDVFCYLNAGTPTLEILAWTNDTTRATALAYQDGILVKSGDATRRYLGTFYTTSATTTEDSDANRYLWNYYNRVSRTLKRLETTATWAYTVQTWRQANASSSNQVNFIVGVSEDEISATVSAMSANSAANVGVWLGIALDSVVAPDRQTYMTNVTAGLGSSIPPASNSYLPAAGRHFVAWLELSGPTGTTTWYAGSGYNKSGILGRMMA